MGPELAPRLTVESEDDSPKTRKRTKPQTHPDMCPKPSEWAQHGASQAYKKLRLEVNTVQEKKRQSRNRRQESTSEPEIETRGRKGEAKLACNKAIFSEISKGQFKAMLVHHSKENGSSDNLKIMGKSGDLSLIIGSAARGGQARSSNRDDKRERMP